MAGLDVERVLSEAFVESLGEHTTDELRQRRRLCESVEAHLSYRRRLLHGHMDLLRAELDRRGGAGPGTVTDLFEHLADGTGGGSNRSPSHQRIDVGGDDEVEGLEGAAALSADLPECSDEELHGRAEQLVSQERTVSTMRRKVLDHLDAIQTEIVRRYRDGSASIDELLPPATA